MSHSEKQESQGMVWIHGMMVIHPVALIHHFSELLIFYKLKFHI